MKYVCVKCGNIIERDTALAYLKAQCDVCTTIVYFKKISVFRKYISEKNYKEKKEKKKNANTKQIFS